MAFDEFDRRERSQADGSPIRLYLLEWGATRWRYTSADQPITRFELVDGVNALVTYLPVACSDEGMTQGGSSNNDFTLRAPGDLPVVDLFRSTPPTKSVWLTVRTVHAPLAGTPAVPQIAEPHRYWRLRFTGSYGSHIGFRDIEMRETYGGPDLTGAGTAVASGWLYQGNNEFDFEPKYAFDPAETTAWVCRDDHDFDQQWIGYDFGEPVAVNEVYTKARSFYRDQAPRGGWLEWSDDGVEWTPLFGCSFTREQITTEFLTWRRPLSAQEADAPIYWIGTVSNVKRPDPAEAMILGRPITASFKRTGLRLCWTRGCPHALYDDECRVNPETHRRAGEVFDAKGATVTVEMADPVPEPARFAGGVIEWSANVDGTTDSRTIESVSGSGTRLVLTLFGTSDRIEPGSACTLLPGCDLTPETCKDRFNNLANYGGFRQMAGKSPFDGTPIF